MLTNYIHTAMHKATYELLEDGTFYAEIPECQGVWANAVTLEACREDLQDALEGWIILGLRLGHTLPILDGINLNFTKEVA
ncbi:MAG: type II toxin-antitoxin system HicB family antitoxin [Nostoc sp. CreGUA01]|nr:type II toxin-antitoxin system HicB family antitoxin [Nostoc sp. CreGUA01]